MSLQKNLRLHAWVSVPQHSLAAPSSTKLWTKIHLSAWKYGKYGCRSPAYHWVSYAETLKDFAWEGFCAQQLPLHHLQCHTVDGTDLNVSQGHQQQPLPNYLLIKGQHFLSQCKMREHFRKPLELLMERYSHNIRTLQNNTTRETGLRLGSNLLWFILVSSSQQSVLTIHTCTSSQLQERCNPLYPSTKVLTEFQLCVLTGTGRSQENKHWIASLCLIVFCENTTFDEWGYSNVNWRIFGTRIGTRIREIEFLFSEHGPTCYHNSVDWDYWINKNKWDA